MEITDSDLLVEAGLSLSNALEKIMFTNYPEGDAISEKIRAAIDQVETIGYREGIYPLLGVE